MTNIESERERVRAVVRASVHQKTKSERQSKIGMHVERDRWDEAWFDVAVGDREMVKEGNETFWFYTFY